MVGTSISAGTASWGGPARRRSCARSQPSQSHAGSASKSCCARGSRRAGARRAARAAALAWDRACMLAAAARAMRPTECAGWIVVSGSTVSWSTVSGSDSPATGPSATLRREPASCAASRRRSCCWRRRACAVAQGRGPGARGGIHRSRACAGAACSPRAGLPPSCLARCSTAVPSTRGSALFRALFRRAYYSRVVSYQNSRQHCRGESRGASV
jgi:hypothetical protein